MPTKGAARLAGAPEESNVLDQPFLDKWREELLARTWEALEELQTRTGQPYYTALRRKTEQPQVRSAQLASQLGADLLVEEVGRSLQSSDPAALEEELLALNLLPYCQTALERRKPGS